MATPTTAEFGHPLRKFKVREQQQQQQQQQCGQRGVQHDEQRGTLGWAGREACEVACWTL